MSIYTANGDKGTTNLSHKKCLKSDDRIQLVGTIDELSSHLGLIKTMMSEAEDIRFIENIQRTLNAVCSGVADPFNREFRTEDDRTGQLEEEISRLEGAVPLSQRRKYSSGQQSSVSRTGYCKGSCKESRT